MNEYVLGVDIGSGSVKLTLLSRLGKIAGTAGCEYPTFYPHVGWCEQEPEDWCKAFRTALRTLLNETGITASQIKALAPDAATHTAVLMDANHNIIRRAILWTDQRCKKVVQWLKEHCLETVEKQCLNTPTTVWTLPQFMWLRENEPEIWSQVHFILFAKDYLRFRLTGTMETDTIDAAGSMFYDVMNQCWSTDLCAVGNIKAQHEGEDGQIFYGTKNFSGGTKVYIDDKTWGLNIGKITVLGRNRYGRYVTESVDVRLIENVRLQRVFKPGVLEIMDRLEAMDGWIWRCRTSQDRKEVKAFVEMWKNDVEKRTEKND